MFIIVVGGLKWYSELGVISNDIHDIWLHDLLIQGSCLESVRQYCQDSVVWQKVVVVVVVRGSNKTHRQGFKQTRHVSKNLELWNFRALTLNSHFIDINRFIKADSLVGLAKQNLQPMFRSVFLYRQCMLSKSSTSPGQTRLEAYV